MAEKLYCGRYEVPAGTTVCSNGQPPTTKPTEIVPTQQNDDSLTLTSSSAFWNQDTRPVQLGSENRYLGGGLTSVPIMSNVAAAGTVFNQIWGAGMAKGASTDDKNNLKWLTSALRAYTGQELGTRGSLEDAWAQVLDDAASSNKDVYALLGRSAGRFGVGPSGSGSGGGGGGYSGPVATTTLLDDRDVDRTANALALELIGRPLSDKELAKVTARLRTEERANPTITTPGTGTSLTQSGLSAEGRADVLREVIAENPEYRQFQVDNTVLDTMLSELNKREQMVNG